MRWSTSASILLSLVVAMFALVNCHPSDFSTQGSDEWQTYVNEEHQFAIDYPPGWKAYPTEYSGDEALVVSLVRQEGFSARSVAVVHKRMQSPTSEDVALWGKERIKELFQSYELGELRPADNYQHLDAALTRTYLADEGDRLTDVYIADGEHAYIITLQTPQELHDDFTSLFAQMVASFEVLE